MTAFDLFQRSTCEISENNLTAALVTLTEAITQIDKDGVDAHMREDLVNLRNALMDH